jgi:hypothetical protein
MLNKKVFDYFINLDKSNLKKKKGAFVCDGKISRLNQHQFIFIDNKPFYIKQWREEFSIFSASSSNLYNQSGIITPPIYKGYNREKNIGYEISQAADSIEDYKYYFTEPKNIEEFIAVIKKSKYYDNKWEMLQNPEIVEMFLSFMTRECFDKYIEHFILSELRTDTDCHCGNFLLYREKNSPKFQGIIPIDLEQGEILTFADYHGDNLKDFLEEKYSTFGPNGYCDFPTNYKNRIENIRALILDGRLTYNQIESIKKALNYDFPKDIKKTFKKFHEKDPKYRYYDIIARLWDYNQTLQRNL